MIQCSQGTTSRDTRFEYRREYHSDEGLDLKGRVAQKLNKPVAVPPKPDRIYGLLPRTGNGLGSYLSLNSRAPPFSAARRFVRVPNRRMTRDVTGNVSRRHSASPPWGTDPRHTLSNP